MSFLRPEYKRTSEFDFCVRQEDNMFNLYDHAKIKKYGYTYEETAIDDMLKSGKSGRDYKQYFNLHGNFPDVGKVTNACIEIPKFSVLTLKGKLKVASGVNKPIIKNLDTDGEQHIEIIDGEWNGYAEGQTETNPDLCAGFEFNYPSAVSSYIKIEHVFMRNIRGHPLYIYKANDVDILDFKHQPRSPWENLATANMIYLYEVGDSRIRWVWGSAKLHCVHLKDCNSDYFAHIYTGAGKNSLYGVGSCYRDFFTDWRADNFEEHAILRASTEYQGFKYCEFHGVLIQTTNGLGADDTWDGFHLNSGSSEASSNIHNLFDGITINQRSGTNLLRYGIYEVSGKGLNNTFGLINGLACKNNYALRKLGTGSKHVADLIQGTVLTS